MRRGISYCFVKHRVGKALLAGEGPRRFWKLTRRELLSTFRSRTFKVARYCVHKRLKETDVADEEWKNSLRRGSPLMESLAGGNALAPDKDETRTGDQSRLPATLGAGASRDVIELLGGRHRSPLTAMALPLKLRNMKAPITIIFPTTHCASCVNSVAITGRILRRRSRLPWIPRRLRNHDHIVGPRKIRVSRRLRWGSDLGIWRELRLLKPRRWERRGSVHGGTLLLLLLQ